MYLIFYIGKAVNNMNKKQLLQNLETIYNRELLDIKEKLPIITHTNRGEAPSYRTFELALKLYSAIGNDQAMKKAFIKFITDDLLKSDETMYASIKFEPLTSTRLSFFILVHLGQIDDAIKILKRRIANGKTFYLIISNFRTLLVYKYRFNHDQLTELEESIKKHARTPVTANIIDNTISRISRIKFSEVSDSLEGTNLEINSDKERVTNWFDEFQFKPELGEFLNNLDNFLHSSDANIASGMIGNFRIFMSDFIEGLAKRIAGNEEIPKYKDEKGNKITPVGRHRRFLKEKLDLSDDDDGLIDAFVELLHEEGGHSMVSKKEYLRLTRNIGIEIVLFILTRYKEKFE